MSSSGDQETAGLHASCGRVPFPPRFDNVYSWTSVATGFPRLYSNGICAVRSSIDNLSTYQLTVNVWLRE